MMQEIAAETQHLIDPELCIRCNNCRESCPIGAIDYDGRNYVVDPAICNSCKACVPGCPTGAIDVWQPATAGKVYTADEQYQWDALPVVASHQVAEGVPEAFYSAHRPATAVVAANVRLTGDTASADVRHIVLAFPENPFPFREGQSVGVLAPRSDALGQFHPMRLYSIASPRDGEGGEADRLALTVKRVIEAPDGRPHRGICSNYVCDLRVGDRLVITGPYGGDFLMPDDEACPLLMICTGTGIAPMRGMIERRRSSGAESGRIALFYGGRTPDDLPYGNDMQALPEGFNVHIAYSRTKTKTYVQDLLTTEHELVASLLSDARCHVYLCGLKGLGTGVFAALDGICTRHGRRWSEVYDGLKRDYRLHVELY